MICSLDGVVMPSADASISVLDEGLLRGDGVFEVARVYAGVPYALDEHLERMTRSAAGLRLPLDAAAFAADVDGLLAASGGGFDGYLRLVATRGGRRIALLEPAKQIAPTIALQTIRYSPTRILDTIKSLSYAANMLVSRLAQEQGADEALLVTPHGRVLEGPRQSFVCSLDGETLVTPPLSDHVLDSITRRRVLETGLVAERSISADELPFATEAFLASTMREVHPVHAIDGVRLAAAPGPLTSVVADRVREVIAAAIAT
ncbi:MAG TPA: aminotransferase class IV [Solirubrobacteraceae bacterium]|nr:aminotransferase class IV [Solirubrobacteraceae bacterium]